MKVARMVTGHEDGADWESGEVGKEVKLCCTAPNGRTPALLSYSVLLTTCPIAMVRTALSAEAP